MDNKLFRHVCFKDLENYFKISDYFENLTQNEKGIVKRNLGIEDSYCKDSHQVIKELVQNRNLIPGGIYVITDYQFMDDGYPSEQYQIVTRAANNSVLDNKVTVIKDGVAMDWDVRYNILEGQRGTITYLKDQNGNEAYYDFKSKRVYIESVGKYLPTFSKFKNGEYVECSNEVYNVTIDQKSNNNTFIITNECRNVLLTESNNNLFNQDIINSTISISDSVIENCPPLSKEEPTVIYKLKDKYILEYLDEETLTKQFIKI